MKNNDFNIDFKPMISELKPKNLQHIEYTTTSFIFKHFPQWFLMLFNKLKFVFAGMAFLYGALAFLLDTPFNMPWLLDHMLIFMPILIVVAVCSLHMNVQTNVGTMRQEEFNKYNDDNIFWSPMDSDNDAREYFDIPDVIGAMAITNQPVSVDNVLAFRDSRLSTGDVVYYTRVYNGTGSDSADEYQWHVRPYSALPTDTDLPSMKLSRKKLDYPYSNHRNVIKMPDGWLDDLIIRNIRKGPSDEIVGALQKNNLGIKIEKLFSRYPEIIAVDILPDMFVIYWIYEIPGDFNSVKALSEKVISQYEMRLAGTFELKSILES